MGKKWIKIIIVSLIYNYVYSWTDLSSMIWFWITPKPVHKNWKWMFLDVLFVSLLSVKIKRNKLSAITEMIEDEINFSFLFTRTWIGEHIFFFHKNARFLFVYILILIFKNSSDNNGESTNFSYQKSHLRINLVVLAITEYWRFYYFHLYQISHRLGTLLFNQYIEMILSIFLNIFNLDNWWTHHQSNDPKYWQIQLMK